MISKNFKTGGSILMYHRVLPDNIIKHDDNLSVSVSQFKEQINFLKQKYFPVSLDDFLNNNSDNKKNQIVITFDDGYKDNLQYAIPILQELNVPATIYVTTRFLENDRSMWWYEIKEFLDSNTNKIEFNYNNQNYFFEINKKNSKKFFLNKITQIIKNLNKIEQEKLMTAITKLNHRKQYNSEVLNWDDLKEICKFPLITIGAHTHNHLSLKNLNENDCLEEIMLSKKLLEDKLGRKIHHFSYPFGSENDVGEREFKMVESLGFKSAVTTFVKPLFKSDKFSLPRIYIGQKTSKNLLRLKLSKIYFVLNKLKKNIQLNN
jgi:peptidoglycan/xylan/chitin deacetylase (PgdA/CDA1 family)